MDVDEQSASQRIPKIYLSPGKLLSTYRMGCNNSVVGDKDVAARDEKDFQAGDNGQPDNSKRSSRFSETFWSKYKADTMKLKSDLLSELPNSKNEWTRAVYNDMIVIIERTSQNIEKRLFRSKVKKGDINKHIFPASYFKPRNLQSWLTNWKPFDHTIDGDAAWSTLPQGVFERDEPTPEQLTILECRRRRTDLTDTKRMARRREQLANYFKRKYKLSQDDLKPYRGFYARMQENEQKLLALCKAPVGLDLRI